MPFKRNPNAIKNICAEKVTYYSFLDAQIAGARPRGSTYKTRIPYQCDECKRWHLALPEPKQRKSKK